MLRPILLAATLIAAPVAATAADAIPIVAAENFYGEVAKAIGGDSVAVTSILSSPDADPHQFEAAPSTARVLADARIVIFNGAGYDPWVERLLAASASPDRTAIAVAGLLGRKPGDNPHLWYDPVAMPALAKAVTARLSEIDPAQADAFARRRDAFLQSLQALDGKIAGLRQRFAGEPVTATEPVFGYMATALGLDMRNEGFQTAIMNEAEPSAREIAAMEDDLKNGQVKVLFYNSQVTDPLTDHLLELARSGGVPVVGVTETEPVGMGYAAWMKSELEATEKALAGPSS